MLEIKFPVLHPSVKLVDVSGTALQIRTPDGLHITFDSNPAVLKEILSYCNGKNSHTEIHALVISNFPEVKPSYLSSLLSLLVKKKIVNEYDDTAAFCVDPYHQSMDYFGKIIKSGFIMLQPTTNGKYIPKISNEFLQIEGRGLVSDAAREAAKRLGFKDAPEGSPERSSALVLCCADNENIKNFRDMNYEYVNRQKRPVVFAYTNDMNFHIGPLVIPGESACFECMFHRRAANVSHLREFEAYIDYCSRESESPLGNSETVSNFALYAMNFLLGGIKNSVFNYIEPGRLIVFDMARMESQKHRLTRLPRCPVCGLGPENRVPQAVRNIV